MIESQQVKPSLFLEGTEFWLVKMPNNIAI